MPGRFANLEFREEPQNGRVVFGTQPTAAYDAREYLTQAHDAYRWGRFETALRLYTRCLEHERAVIPAWVGQVQMLVQLGEHHEARLWSDKALELFRDNGEVLAAKAQAWTRLRDFRAGYACSDAALQTPGSSPWRWQARGEVLLAQGQHRFRDCFEKALAEPQADWFDRVIIARIYVYYQRTLNALECLKAAAELEPTHGYVWFEMGNCQAALAMTSAARASYARCRELRRDYVEARRAVEALDAMSFWTWLKARLTRRSSR